MRRGPLYHYSEWHKIVAVWLIAADEEYIGLSYEPAEFLRRALPSSLSPATDSGRVFTCITMGPLYSLITPLSLTPQYFLLCGLIAERTCSHNMQGSIFR